MVIPFTKAHGAKNDFLLTWAADAPLHNHPEIARAICDRHTGIGADGWYLVRPPDNEADASLKLYNSDGSNPEMSGNGTRCAAAFLIANGFATRDVAIMTGAGLRTVQLIAREENHFEFEMAMGVPRIDALRTAIQLRSGSIEATILDSGNPQCSVFIEDDFPDNWRELGRELESHPMFPNRTNVSFVKVLDEHSIDVRFFERGAGETQSSGTGSTGAAAAAVARGLASSPVTVHTPAGPLFIDWRGDHTYLTGPADIVGRGEFYLDRLLP